MPDPPNTGYRRLVRLAPRAIGLLLLGFLLSRIEWPRIRDGLAGLDRPLIAVAIALSPLFVLAKSIRWYAIVRLQGYTPGIAWSMRVYLVGSFFSLVTPGKVGDISKAVYLERERAVPYPSGVASVLLDRVLDLLALATAGFIAVLATGIAGRFVWSILAFAALLAAGVALLVNPSWVARQLPTLTRLDAWSRAVARVRGFLGEVWRESARLWGPGLMLPAALTVVAYGFLFVACFALGQALHLPLTVLNVVYCVTVANVVSLLPVSISGIGTRDATIVILFSQLDIAPADAVLFSLGYFFLFGVVTGGLGALLFLAKPGKSRPDQEEQR